MGAGRRRIGVADLQAIAESEGGHARDLLAEMAHHEQVELDVRRLVDELERPYLEPRPLGVELLHEG
jgi:hypothetical protein